MTDKQIIIDGIDVSGCLFYQTNFEEDYDVKIKHYCSNWHNSCESDNNSNCYYKQLKRKEQECEELHSRTASIIYSLTGGRLSYSTYTLEGCEQAYHDQLEINVERATKELQEENETLKQEVSKFKQALAEIIRFFKEDEKFARYSGRPIIFVKPALEKNKKKY